MEREYIVLWMNDKVTFEAKQQQFREQPASVPWRKFGDLFTLEGYANMKDRLDTSQDAASLKSVFKGMMDAKKVATTLFKDTKSSVSSPGSVQKPGEACEEGTG